MIPKTLLALLLTSVGQVAHAHKSSQDVVNAMFAAFNKHDPRSMEILYASDARLTSSDFCHPRNRSDVIRTYQALFTAFPDIYDDVTTMVVQGDRVAVRFVARGARGGMALTIHTFPVVRNGKIVEDNSVFDTGGRPCEA